MALAAGCARRDVLLLVDARIGREGALALVYHDTRSGHPDEDELFSGNVPEKEMLILQPTQLVPQINEPIEHKPGPSEAGFSEVRCTHS